MAPWDLSLQSFLATSEADPTASRGESHALQGRFPRLAGSRDQSHAGRTAPEANPTRSRGISHAGRLRGRIPRPPDALRQVDLSQAALFMLAVTRGGIDKRGNANPRRLLVEAAPGIGARSPRPPARAPEGVPRAVADKALLCGERLRRRRAPLDRRGVPANKAKVAVARELAEWAYYVAAAG